MNEKVKVSLGQLMGERIREFNLQNQRKSIGKKVQSGNLHKNLTQRIKDGIDKCITKLGKIVFTYINTCGENRKFIN